jgi:hypothetical protein
MLAVAALLLSLLTIPLNAFAGIIHVPIGFLGFVPGIVCGHLALARIRGDRSLTGVWLARIGLAIGYLCVAIVLLAVTLRLTGHGQHQVAAPLQHSFPTPAPPAMPAPQNPSRRTAIQDPKVTTDPGTTEIPKTAASGTLMGRPFKVDRAQLLGGGLHLIQGKGTSVEQEVIIFLNREAATDGPARKTILFPQSGRTLAPSIHLRGTGGGGLATDNYALRLEFGAATGSSVPGKIYLELSESHQTKLAGSFVVEAK